MYNHRYHQKESRTVTYIVLTQILQECPSQNNRKFCAEKQESNKK